MNRYDILLKKIPPPPPKKKKEKKKRVSKEQLDREQIISRLLTSGQGRTQLAASMANPIRQQMDHVSLARRIFRVEPLPAGALPVYDRVENEPVYAIDGDQQVININRQRRLLSPIIELSSNPSIPLSQLRGEHRYELIDGAQQQAVNTIRDSENILAFRLVDRITDDKKIEVQEITPEIIVSAMSLIERNDLRVASIFMHPQVYVEHFRNVFRDHIDVVTQRRLLEMGLMGSIWGAQIYVSNTIPNHNIYFAAEPQFVGVMPIREDLTVLSADDPAALRIGWMIVEQIGMMCFNSRGLTRISLIHNTPEKVEESVSPIQAWDGTEWVEFKNLR